MIKEIAFGWLIGMVLVMSISAVGIVHYKAYEDCKTAESIMDNNLNEFSCSFLDNKMTQHSWYVDGIVTPISPSTIDFDKVEWGRLI